MNLSVQGLSAWYGARQAVRGVSLEFRAHDVTALIGPPGCGKSTLLRCLNRMHELTKGARLEGTVGLDGHDIYDADIDALTVRRKIGMVFDKPNPFPTMSIRDNVLAGLRLTRTAPVGSPDELVERALSEVGLWDEVRDRLDLPGLELSGGQQQLLCIARAIAVDPQVLLMDEPCSALDPTATTRIENLLHTLRERHTIVLVAHDVQQAARVSQRTAFLVEGTVVEMADTGRFFTSPTQRRTEDYVTGKFG